MDRRIQQWSDPALVPTLTSAFLSYVCHTVVEVTIVPKYDKKEIYVMYRPVGVISTLDEKPCHFHPT